jgi:phage host-nuclease inhibitor protein Gam
MVTLEQTHNGQTRRATVTRGPVGWHYQEVRNSTIVRDVTYMDWHRVERAMQVFERGDVEVHSTKR